MPFKVQTKKIHKYCITNLEINILWNALKSEKTENLDVSLNACNFLRQRLTKMGNMPKFSLGYQLSFAYSPILAKSRQLGQIWHNMDLGIFSKIAILAIFLNLSVCRDPKNVKNEFLDPKNIGKMSKNFRIGPK